MGRGRAKAKQTKVARQLKYSSGGTDLDRLQAELASARGDVVEDEVADDEDEFEDDYDDPYADAYDDGDDEDEDEPGASRR